MRFYSSSYVRRNRCEIRLGIEIRRLRQPFFFGRQCLGMTIAPERTSLTLGSMRATVVTVHQYGRSLIVGRLEIDSVLLCENRVPVGLGRVVECFQRVSFDPFWRDKGRKMSTIRRSIHYRHTIAGSFAISKDSQQHVSIVLRAFVIKKHHPQARSRSDFLRHRTRHALLLKTGRTSTANGDDFRQTNRAIFSSLLLFSIPEHVYGNTNWFRTVTKKRSGGKTAKQ